MPGEDWIACDRLLDPRSAELGRILEAERRASGQVSDHATALTVMAVYAGTVTAAAVLAWAVEGGVAHGCAAAFCIAGRRGGDVDQLESAYKTFSAVSTIDLDRLGKVVRLTADDREGLFYLRDTCCLYYTSMEETKCSSCCLDSVDQRIANYRRVLVEGVVPH
ncbi:hypothetical protein [Nonomuraea aurantiaca]|uniref:hypothetical protein n=1 Tax=Nonomuraea aurantiaca TaxID=2878562 RepID=UPI001CDA374A|nr:hypothetical protein [Nonomuraea aurantiaca]MCA2221056.1 hypothetical protein [Nonomuraea aurantiaca]